MVRIPLVLSAVGIKTDLSVGLLPRLRHRRERACKSPRTRSSSLFRPVLLNIHAFALLPPFAPSSVTRTITPRRAHPSSPIRRSINLVSSYRRPRRKGRTAVADASFFDPISTVFVDDESQISPSTPTTNTTSSTATPTTITRMPTLTKPLTQTPQRRLQTRRAVLRMDAQDGPWTISAAENPHDASSYSLYVKSEFISPCLLRYPYLASITTRCFYALMFGVLYTRLSGTSSISDIHLHISP